MRTTLAALALFLQLPTTFAGDAMLDPAITQATIAETICTPGYTSTIRPPWTLTAKIKLALLHSPS
jgi:hypothetical protein